ncbi:MAG: R3H domain-containing nucleic acid-binding protein [Candidatus Tumulicola sp.]
MLYEDDFEYEEQPADIRDRAIPGRPGGDNRVQRGGGGVRRTGGRPPGNGRRYGAPLHRSSATTEHFDLPDNAKPAHGILAELLRLMGLQNTEIHYIPRSEGEYLEVTGPELGMLIGRHGNTLEAMNLVINNALNAGVRNNRRYYTVDAEGYRARRAEQLKSLALATRDRAIRESSPQRLEPMLPSERKIVHLALTEFPDVRTESEGEEPERRVVIFPA